MHLCNQERQPSYSEPFCKPLSLAILVLRLQDLLQDPVMCGGICPEGLKHQLDDRPSSAKDARPPELLICPITQVSYHRMIPCKQSCKDARCLQLWQERHSLVAQAKAVNNHEASTNSPT